MVSLTSWAVPSTCKILQNEGLHSFQAYQSIDIQEGQGTVFSPQHQCGWCQWFTWNSPSDTHCQHAPPLTLSNLLLPQMRLPGLATTPQIPGMLSGTGDLNALPTSAPSSYLLPSIISESTSSAVTRISSTKRKVSSLVTNSVASLPKQSCPLSATAQVQQVGGAAMQEIAAVIKDFSRSMAPPDILGAAIDLPPATLQTYTHTTTQYRRISCTQKKTRIKPHFSISLVKKREKSGCHTGCLRLWPPLIGWRTRNYVISCLFVVLHLCYVYYQLE